MHLRLVRVFAITFLASVLWHGCSSPGSSHLDGGTSDLTLAPNDLTMAPSGDGAVLTGNNVVPVIVDEGPDPIASPYTNYPYVSVQICVPGTSNCQTVDHIQVDTGSPGLRIEAAALPASFIDALTQAKDEKGDPLAQCYAFVSSYVWGSVRMADFTVGSKQVPSMAFQLIADPAFATVPSGCASTGQRENTVDSFGANGLLGVDMVAADCGASCEDPTQLTQPSYPYYGCPTSGSCAPVSVPISAQVTNPVALFSSDNNGVVLQLPSVPATGATTVSGALIFGIGTQPNNALGDATVLTLTRRATVGTVTRVRAELFALDIAFGGQDHAYGIFDSGSSYITFADSTLPQCTGGFGGLFCPTSTTSLTAVATGANGVMKTIDFDVANATSVEEASPGAAAFDDIALAWTDDSFFSFGLPFFYGRTVFTAIEGASTPGGPGPYYAF